VWLNWWDSSHPLKPNKLAFVYAKWRRKHIPEDEPLWDTPGQGVPQKTQGVQERSVFLSNTSRVDWL
jgi:hypothetical protein